MQLNFNVWYIYLFIIQLYWKYTINRRKNTEHIRINAPNICKQTNKN